MRLMLALSLILLAGVSHPAGVKSGKVVTGVAINTSIAQAVHKSLWNDLTFYAPLTENTVAWGRGSTTPTYSGGGMTGAGSMRSYEGCDGLIHWASSGPVFDCGKGYQSMGARTNSITYSYSPNGSGWINANCTVTQFSDTSPDGTVTSSLVGAVANGASLYFPTTLAGGAYASSVYIKRKTGTGLIYLTSNAGTATGWTAVTVTTAYTRVSDVDTTASPAWGLQFQTANDEVYIWNMQLEAGGFMSPPVKTAGATGARAADVLNYSPANNVSGTAGSALWTFDVPTVSSGGTDVVLSIGSAATGWLSYMNAGANKMYDGTNLLFVTPVANSSMKGMSYWGVGGMGLYNNTQFTSGAFDGSMNGNELLIGTTTWGRINGISIFATPLSRWEKSLVRP